MLLKWLHNIVKHHLHVCFRLSELELYPHHSYLSISLSVWAGLYLFFIIERFLKIFMDAKARRRGENIASGHGHGHNGDTSYQQQRSALLGAGAGDQDKTVDGTQALTDNSEEDTNNK